MPVGRRGLDDPADPTTHRIGVQRVTRVHQPATILVGRGRGGGPPRGARRSPDDDPPRDHRPARGRATPGRPENHDRTEDHVRTEDTEQPKAASAASYDSCAQAKAAGAAPLHVGEPGYSRKFDRDDDGVACET